MENLDASNYSSSPHRLPRVSASQALRDSNSSTSRAIPTGLAQFDALLHGGNLSRGDSNSGSHAGGLPRGQVTEIYGPPGVGKTTLAMQICANALDADGEVVWVDTSYVVAAPRLKEIVAMRQNTTREVLESPQPLNENWDELLRGFHHFTTPSLPHLLALLLHPTASFPPSKTSVIVIDAVSTLFGTAFPIPEGNRVTKDVKSQPKAKNDRSQWALSRKWAVIGEFISKLSKLAVLKDVAVILLTQVKTKIQQGTGAVLHPSVSSSIWDANVANQLILFRDDVTALDRVDGTGGVSHRKGCRFVGLIKNGGVVLGGGGGVGKAVPFVIERGGIRSIAMPVPFSEPSTLPIVSGPLKRKRDEVRDSQSEDDSPNDSDDYGWDDNDDVVAEEGLQA